MTSIFMNSENSKTSDAHKPRLNLTDKMDLGRGNKHVALSDLSFYYTWKNMKRLCICSKFKISATTLGEEFELLYGSYSMSDIHDYLEYIFKKHETLTNKSLIQIHFTKIQSSYSQD